MEGDKNLINGLYRYYVLIIMYSNSTVSSRYLRDIPSPLPSPVRDPYNYTLNDELSRQ